MAPVTSIEVVAYHVVRPNAQSGGTQSRRVYWSIDLQRVELAGHALTPAVGLPAS